jgi:hypothetical protein
VVFHLFKRNPYLRIWYKNFAEKVSQLCRYKFVVLWLACVNSLVHSLSGLCLERCLARDYLDHQNTKAPYVHLIAVAVVPSQYLRCNICGCSAICHSFLIYLFQSFGKSKIHQF